MCLLTALRFKGEVGERVHVASRTASRICAMTALHLSGLGDCLNESAYHGKGIVFLFISVWLLVHLVELIMWKGSRLIITVVVKLVLRSRFLVLFWTQVSPYPCRSANLSKGKKQVILLQLEFLPCTVHVLYLKLWTPMGYGSLLSHARYTLEWTSCYHENVRISRYSTLFCSKL
jgi:hypothetical protein